MFNRQAIYLAIALTTGSAALVSGCAPAVVTTQSDVAVGIGVYHPLYYDGYAVYYDAAGLPYYYVGGAPFFIPSTYARYNIYVDHYRTHREEYERWHGAYGHEESEHRSTRSRDSAIDHHAARPHPHPRPFPREHREQRRHNQHREHARSHPHGGRHR